MGRKGSFLGACLGRYYCDEIEIYVRVEGTPLWYMGHQNGMHNSLENFNDEGWCPENVGWRWVFMEQKGSEQHFAETLLEYWLGKFKEFD